LKSLIFQDLGEKLNSVFDIIETVSTVEMIKDLKAIVVVWITITIMIKGYQALAGKATDPVRDVVWDIFIKVCIMAFVLNFDGYLTLVTDAMNELFKWAGGGENMYVKLDELLGKTRDLANMVWKKGNVATGSIALLLVYIGFAIAVLPGLMVIVITQFVLKIVIMLAPFMFFALMFGWLKNMFSQWLSIFFANLLTVLIVTIFFNALIAAFEMFIRFNDTDVVFIGVKVVITGVVFSALIGVAKTLAEKIATVGLESAMQGALGKLMPPMPPKSQKSPSPSPIPPRTPTPTPPRTPKGNK
jgi:type IV secretion system protein VirB6